MDYPVEAGPSRPSPSRNLPPSIVTSSADIIMEDVSTTVPKGGEPDDAVALLLNISSAVDVPPTLPPKPDQIESIIEDQARLIEKSIPPDIHSYPYTPPEDKDANDPRPEQPEQIPIIPPPSASLSNILSSSHTDNSSPIAHPPTPTHTSPDPPVKPKGKRKRNTTAGSSRRASTDHPPHWLGEDNSIIRCICGFTEDDGFTIQCEGCFAWEHGMCFGYMDETSAPEQYFCELCKPRPFDAANAKRMQIIMQDQQKQAREAAIIESGGVGGGIENTVIEKEKPRSKSGKTKKARTENVLEGELDKDKESGKEHSPGVMGPPTIKPKRRQPGPKPRVKQAPIDSSTPGPSFKEQQQQQQHHQQVIQEEPEDDYFRIEPWVLEYTPIKENIIRGVAARQIMRNVYREWVDAEEEVVAAKSRAVHNPSGLPSPTETGILRLSPDNLFPPPDFHILAPPVPPVYLTGPDLESLASPISIRIVEDAPSFLPLTYAENISKHGVYTRPTIYSVFAEEPINLGSFVGEFKGEVIDCESYRKDPINQYSSLGLPKPHVRSIGPPINLMIDARGYGNDLRFVRSGCHPNVVLRPLLWRSNESESLKLKFGLFAAKDIGKKDELILGWEWDDQHVVHSLRSIVHAAMLNDGSLASPGFSLNSNPKLINSLSNKIDSVLTHIFGTFTSCACNIPGTCALAQMGQLVEPKISLQDGQSPTNENGRKKQRVDLGELVGAVRGWRRRELELNEIKKWNLNEIKLNSFDLGLSRISSRTSEANSQSQSQSQSQPQSRAQSHSRTQSVQSEDQDQDQRVNQDDVQSSSDKAINDSMGQDVEVDEESEEEAETIEMREWDKKEILEKPDLPQSVKEDEDVTMEIEESTISAENQLEPEVEKTVKIVSPQPASSPPRIEVPVVDFVHASDQAAEQSPQLEPLVNSSSASKLETPVTPKHRISSSPPPRTPKSERQGSSSSLSSAMSSIKPSLGDGIESDSESDATTATIPKSQFSESDGESAITEEEEEATTSGPAKPHSTGNTRKIRRVLSPVFESSKYMNGHGVDEDHEMSEEERELVIKKPKKNKLKIPESSSKSSTKSKSSSIPNRKPFLPKKLNSQINNQQVKRGRTKRIMSSSSASDDDPLHLVDVDEHDFTDEDESTIGTPARRKRQKKLMRDIGSSPISGKSIKLEKLENMFAEVVPITSVDSTKTQEEIPRAVVPDQITAPMSSALEMDEAIVPDPEIVPTAETQPIPEIEEEERDTIGTRENTPVPKEPTPPPKEPTPPPEPPKKISLSDYLKSHRIRKESQTPISEVPTPKVDVTSTPEVIKAAGVGAGGGSFDDIPGFGNMTASTTTITSSPTKGESETPTLGGKLNLLEHLPSNRSVSTTTNTPLETPRPTTSGSSYVPRNVSGGSTDYFPVQPVTSTATSVGGTNSFIPRVSSSYIPRQISITENDSTSTTSATNSLGLGLNTNSYVPRSNSTVSTTDDSSIIKSPINQPIEMPPPLPVREPPPHTSREPTTPSGNNSSLPKVPPTGPKVPPTGPRGLTGLSTPSVSPITPISISRGESTGGFRGGTPGSGSIDNRGGHGYGSRSWRGRRGTYTRGTWRGA